jgi:hypothetical protein
LNQENQFGPWFTLSDTEKQQIGSPMGPQNPQALNRYSYVLNNPMRWTDPTGHAPPSPCMANQSCWYNKVYDGIQQAVGEVAADILNFGIGLGQSLQRTGRAPEFDGGRLTQDQFLNQAEKYLGQGYREESPGRYISADGMRQVRYGDHEINSTIHHAHFEAYDSSYYAGGRVIENTVIEIIP